MTIANPLAGPFVHSFDVNLGHQYVDPLQADVTSFVQGLSGTTVGFMFAPSGLSAPPPGVFGKGFYVDFWTVEAPADFVRPSLTIDFTASQRTVPEPSSLVVWCLFGLAFVVRELGHFRWSTRRSG
jgi:hypothetical protein